MSILLPNSFRKSKILLVFSIYGSVSHCMGFSRSAFNQRSPADMVDSAKGLFLDDGFGITRSFADIGEFLMDRCFSK